MVAVSGVAVSAVAVSVEARRVLQGTNTDVFSRRGFYVTHAPALSHAHFTRTLG